MIVSELMLYVVGIVDDVCFIKSMCIEVVNYVLVINFFLIGLEMVGCFSMGVWLIYGLGSEMD